ncbi:hypothetical protein Q5762_31450 [Streptomyces sp. P9(2023)]|nr:hypothetical protein [Streptomyces sp. P9(2023)]MDT9692761.1 hypothetical protein [Streptomyces sp. P9(2023)]
MEADRVEGGQDGDGAGEVDVLGGLGDGGERDGGVGDVEVGSVVLAEGEDVQPAWSAATA